jgi:hypothetical protein
MKGKRELVSNRCAATGTAWLLEHIPRRPVLMILNCHRIGDKDATEYDPGLFSCTAEGRRVRLADRLSEEQLSQVLKRSRRAPRGSGRTKKVLWFRGPHSLELEIGDHAVYWRKEN